MGVFSEIAMEQQNSMFDSSAAFEDDEAFELEEMESLPVPPVGTDTVPVSAASVSAGETASADAEEEPVDEVASDGEEKSAEEGNSAQPPAAEDEEKKRAEHEAAEAQRKAEFDAKQQAKKAAEQEQIARLEAMSDEEVIAASTQRVSTDVEKLTRRNMKECVSEHIQMLCMEDTAFARLTMHPKKNMIRCFQYINRKAWDYVQDELKASGTHPGPGQQTYGCDVPDDMCYQWAEDYFRDPDAKEDCALPGFVDSKNEEKTERNAGYLVVSQSGGGMLRQGTREGIRRTPANRGMRAHRIVKGLDISEDVCHGMCP